jgi:hypothetical protein
VSSKSTFNRTGKQIAATIIRKKWRVETAGHVYPRQQVKPAPSETERGRRWAGTCPTSHTPSQLPSDTLVALREFPLLCNSSNARFIASRVMPPLLVPSKLRLQAQPRTDRVW